MDKKTIWDMNRDTVEQFRAKEKLPLVVVLDNVRSLNNIGSIFRTSDAFNVECIVLCGISATPPSSEIHKTALGAEDSVSWRYERSSVNAVMKLKSEGYKVCCLEQVKGSVSLERFLVESGERYAVVVGNEVDGVSQEVVDICDFHVEIPQEGTKHSLNVSVSTGIALWHFFVNMNENIKL